jgi:NtrC-family two-component system response regulator AlgB
VILWPAQVIEPQAFPAHIAARVKSAEAPQVGGNFSLEEIEREHIVRVVGSSPTLEDAAAILGIDSSTLWRKRKKIES